MTINEYQKECLRTEEGMDKKYPRIFNGLMGLNGEAGEAIDIKKNIYSKTMTSIKNIWQKSSGMLLGTLLLVQTRSGTI